MKKRQTSQERAKVVFKLGEREVHLPNDMLLPGFNLYEVGGGEVFVLNPVVKLNDEAVEVWAQRISHVIGPRLSNDSLIFLKQRQAFVISFLDLLEKLKYFENKANPVLKELLFQVFQLFFLMHSPVRVEKVLVSSEGVVILPEKGTVAQMCMAVNRLAKQLDENSKKKSLLLSVLQKVTSFKC